MGVPQEVLNRLFDVGEVMGLILREGDSDIIYGLRVRSYESTTLFNQSLGTASALAAAGTGWSQIQDSNNRYLLQPQQQGYVYQCFHGISPSNARVYTAYPPNQNRGSLVVPITVGGAFGYLTGRDAPYESASAITEFMTMYGGLQPAWNGYNPNGLPSSMTVYMNFWIWKYSVDLVQLVAPTQPAGATAKRTIPVGGIPPADAPQWLITLRQQGQISQTPAAMGPAARGMGSVNMFGR